MKTNKAQKDIIKLLVIEASKKVKNDHEARLIKSIDVKNCSYADICLLNEIAYGNSEGISVTEDDLKTANRKYSEESVDEIIKERLRFFGI